MLPIYRIMLMVFLTAFVLAQTNPALQQPQFNLALSYSPPYIYPGSVVQLYITLVSAQPLSNVYVDVDSPFKVLTGSTIQVQQLSAGVPATFISLVQIPLDARPGYYRIRVTAYTLTRSAESSVDIEVLPFDFSTLVVPRPTSYLAGQAVQLPVLLFNPTADFLKVRVSINGSVVSRFLNSSLSCDAVVPPKSNSTCLLNFALSKDLRPGFYNATLEIALSSLSGYAGSVVFRKTVQLPVVSGAEVNVLATPSQQPIPGSPTLVTLAISQGGPAPLQNVTVQVLDGDGVKVLAGGVVAVPVLTQLQLPVQLLITKQGEVRIPVEICYFSGTCIIKYADLYIPRSGLFINAVFNPPQGYPGSLTQATFVIATNYTMSNVGVEVYSPFKAITSTSSAIPFIAPQSPATFNIIFEIPRDAKPGVYPINISVAGTLYTFHYEVLRPEFNVAAVFNPPVAYPGALISGTLTVVSPFNARNVNISISTPLTLLTPSSYYVPYMPQGQPYSTYLVIQIPDGYPPGRYPIAVSINGISYTYYITVSQPNVVIQNVLVTPPKILEGTPVAQVNVQVINTGPVVARNVTVTLLNSTIGRQSYTLDYLPPGSPVTLTFYIDASKLSPGNYNVVALASWEGGGSTARGLLEIGRKDSLRITYRVYNVAPGSTAVLMINVTNLGPEEAKNVRISLTPSQVFELHASNIADAATAGVRILGDVPPGATVSTAFLLDVSDKAVNGIYTLTLVLTWNQTGVFAPALQYVNIPIEVRGGLDMFVVVPLVLTIVLVLAGIAMALRRRRRG
ncbi:NEW3 domain-containing protein [Pyrobaculum ferrireducens]|nr:NEW3 domain-containing protein [Pyrobaculum ferrireducens]